MIAVGAEPQDPQLDQPFSNVPFVLTGDELPSTSCDFADLNLPLGQDEIEDLLLQNFNDMLLPLDGQMHFGETPPASLDIQNHVPCDLTAALLEDTRRPRDLNLSFAGDSIGQSLSNLASSLNLSFGQSGNVTPTYPGGATPEHQSRATSPTWSESSGSISTSSVSNSAAQQNCNTIPRHKRPSHKRAEIKRRGKIKTCLDDLKEYVPSLRDKGKLSESAILSKAAEYIHQLKDGCTERGCKTANLRREIQCLSEEIHCFQESLPASGLKEEAGSSHLTLDDLYQNWLSEQNHNSTKFSIFTSITSKLFDSFKEVVGPTKTLDSFNAQAKEWQASYLSLPVLRKVILNGMLALSRKTNLLALPDTVLKMDPDSDNKS